MTIAKVKFEPTGDGGPSLARATRFVLGLTPEAIPPEVMERAALLLLDTLGVAIAAIPMDPGVIARETAVRLHSTQDPAFSARLMFDGRRVSLAGAAFASTTAIDNLDAHDGYNPTKGHIGVVVIPTLAALAETLPHLSGPEALAALVVGYEVSGRAATALHATVPEYHTSGAWNALGVAAMVARLRRFTPGQLREALGIAEFHGPRSQMMREIATPTMLHDGSSFGAMVGVTSAIQAELGFTGAPAVTVEDPEVIPHWADLGEVWQVPLQYIKPYPTCRWAHAALDGLRALFLAHDIRTDEIARVDVRTFFNAVELYSGVPDTTSRAQYSMEFPLAAMVVYRRVGVEHIAGDGLKDPAVIAMMSRIHVVEDAHYTANYPAKRWADVTITLKDGRVLESGLIHARGGPEAPFGQAEIVEKFREFAVPVLGEARATAICERVLGLTAPGSRFSDLAHLLYTPSTQKD
ncbi:MAG: MmgE/PrpD family protein [Gemmobacter sp.]|jgi:2-methylcitrate dehydratase PrpD|nr:MmgE/PrpD family protein [Gemmobacter sp.]